MPAFQFARMRGHAADLTVHASTDYTGRIYLRLAGDDEQRDVTISGTRDEIEDFAARMQQAVDNLTSELDSRIEVAS